ncbi:MULTISPECIES: carbohydrate kinase family protein [Actinoalloteichus]|uniref:Sugar kinase, ribokinase n=1 Tax=Actinoalloteichus fjordicus TaxID=1612552 RepID=A0AAC9PUW3_9PSEU|nr:MULTISPECIES: carbohydrate kinase [Actinoalloteichus]APU17648.1 sugar kinase, ribokinase [Actinoalloteichus fjordicus]APU23724.1 sugar kinase, ribokinase [Actinoalloteichus sp. GBA129-24]
MILVGGEALVDLVPEQSADRRACEDDLASLSPRLGGGPFNVAMAAGRLGVPTGFLSRISTDSFGRALLARLTASGVDVTLVQRGQEPTSLAVVDLDGGGSARYTFHVAATADRLVEEPATLPAEVTALCLGTLGMVLEPGASRYESLLRRAVRRGTLTMLDPNIRAALIPDAAAYRSRFLSWLPDVGVLKLSDDDAAWLADVEPGEPAPLSEPAEVTHGVDGAQESLGVDPRVLAAARRWQEAGPAAVILTRGADGLLVLFSGGRLVEVPGVPVTVVDTIGAGDTVSGAVLAWLHRHGAVTPAGLAGLDEGGWTDCLSFAAAASALTCSRQGAEPPWAAELAGWSTG